MFWQLPLNHLNRDFDSLLKEFNRLFADAPSSYGAPRVNVWTNEDQTVISAEVPGVDPDQIEISVHENRVRIAGDRTPVDVKDGEAVTWHRSERLNGKFARTVTLPYRIDS